VWICPDSAATWCGLIGYFKLGVVSSVVAWPQSYPTDLYRATHFVTLVAVAVTAVDRARGVR
jgi:hypothetical protein